MAGLDQVAVPNAFAAQSGNVPASQLDSDFTAVAKQLAGYGMRGFRGVNTAASPTTQYDLVADLVVLRNTATGQTAVFANTGTVTCDTAVAGPTANGRDQAGAFGASNWVYFYFIWNGVTLASLVSLTAPPTGPVLPAGYTHWAFATAVYWTAGAVLTAITTRGNVATYVTRPTALSGGAAVVNTAVNLATMVPPGAGTVHLAALWALTANGAGVLDGEGDILPVAGASAYLRVLSITNGWTNSTRQTFGESVAWVPLTSQQVFYINIVTTGSSPALSLFVLAYTVPNAS